jgi:hypothetical protein
MELCCNNVACQERTQNRRQLKRGSKGEKEGDLS